MENIFDSLTHYGIWKKTAEREFNQAELSSISSASVVEGNHGLIVCFMMKAGGRTYLGLSPNSHLAIGEEIDLTRAKLITLSKPGECDIHMVEA